MVEISRILSGDLVTIDRHVNHVSTIPAIAGEPVRLFVREKFRQDASDSPVGDAPAAERGVVLMVHGGYWPGTMAFDFGHKNYSWMAALVHAGLDVCAIFRWGPREGWCDST